MKPPPNTARDGVNVWTLKRMAPAKTLIIQFHLHLSTKNDCLADFSRSCVLSKIHMRVLGTKKLVIAYSFSFRETS